MSSRILKRNQILFRLGTGGELTSPPTPNMPQLADPRRVAWDWPKHVNNPVKYANYVDILHRRKGLKLAFPKGAFQRLGGRCWDIPGREILLRATYLAMIQSRFSFSPKFVLSRINIIKETIEERPKPITFF